MFYLSTICVCAALFVCLAESGIKSKFVLWMGKISDKYGLDFYIYQVTIIKTLDYIFVKSKMMPSETFYCIRPIIYYAITLIIIVIIDRLMYILCFKKRK